MLGLLLLALVGCTPRVSIHTMSDLKPNELLLVGKIELVPPLKPDEQLIGSNFIFPSDDADPHDRIYLSTGPKWVKPEGPTSYRKDIDTGDALAMLKGDPTVTSMFTGKFGEWFFAPVPDEEAYVVRGHMIQTQTSGSGGWGPMRLGATNGQFIWAYFPGGLHFTPKPGDKAVYVGTVRYYRDKNLDVSRIAVVDEFNQARKAFEARFKDHSIPLQKRLFTKVPGLKFKY